MRNMSMSRSSVVRLSLVLLACAPLAGSPAAQAPSQVAETIAAASVRAAGDLDRLLPASTEKTYKALAARFDPSRALEIVTFMDRYWRVAGNTGFNASLDHIEKGLTAAGFGRAPAAGGFLTVAEYPNGGNGWEPVRAELTIVEAAGGKTPEAVFDPVVDYIALCINSFSTPPAGVVARLVYVGKGTDAASYDGIDVKGAVVLGDGGMRGLWAQAVKQRGALGVISAQPPGPYTRPDVTPEVFQWGGVPYDEAARAFGFNASRRVAQRLRGRLEAGPVKVKATIETRFKPGSPGRYLVAEIPGRTAPGQRIVLVAHVQEPGANDDASGCATLFEMARGIRAAIAEGAIPPPARTLTFIWGDEMRVSREWLRADEARARNSRYMMSLDMTGEDTRKTGGSFLIEKEPDPSAVWFRPSDPHTEWWGGETTRAETLQGSLLNDVVLAACLRRARDTGWNVQTNPYEGGSDHTMFVQAGVPALLATHFTDRFYHTNLDRADKTSPAEMANVGVAFGTAAVLLASADEADAIAVAGLVTTAAERRLALEKQQGADAAILQAWTRWYGRALEGVLQLPAGGAGEVLARTVRDGMEKLR
jgi:aminopeptidase YwaD